MRENPVTICPKRRLRRAVCEAFGVEEEALLGRSRHRRLIDARYAFAIVVRERWPGFSYPRIGDMLGGRDHATILHGLAGFRERMARDPVLADIVGRLRADRPAVQHNAHVLTWRAEVLAAAEAAERLVLRAAKASKYDNQLRDVVEEGVRAVSLKRRVRPGNELAPDDRDALCRKNASDALSAAIAAAGGYR